MDFITLAQDILGGHPIFQLAYGAAALLAGALAGTRYGSRDKKKKKTGGADS